MRFFIFTGRSVGDIPNTRTSPSCGKSIPIAMWMSVVFPKPLRPRRATISSPTTLKETSDSTGAPFLNDHEMF